MSEVGPIDAAIDRAVREMLDVEPPPDLRAKVIARIDTTGDTGATRAPGAFAFRWKLLIPIAAAAAILIVAVALARRAEAPVKLRGVATDQILPSPQPEAQNVAPVPTPPRSVPVTARARSTVVATVAAALGPETSTTAIEPLNTISPIEVTPIAPRSITPDPIGVRPLDPITEMQIAPLNPPDRRD